RKDPPVLVMGADLLHNIFGIVTDGFGTVPFPHVPVQLRGTVAGKTWQTSAQTDGDGIFEVEMPVGLDGEVTATAQLANGDSPRQTVAAGDLAPGLDQPDESTAPVNLDGTWKFQPDPSPDFYRVETSDADWKAIHVPSHWTMEGFDSKTGMAAYRRHLQIPD